MDVPCARHCCGSGLAVTLQRRHAVPAAIVTCRPTSPPSSCATRHRHRQHGAAHLRALRLLHRDLPDLRAARRRVGQSARPHLPDQGHAGIRPPATEEVVRHVDRCLSCLSCMTTCPSGVHYMHLVDHARDLHRADLAAAWHDRALRALLGRVLPSPALFRLSLLGARLARPFAGAAPAVADGSGAGCGRCWTLAPQRLPARNALQDVRVHPCRGRAPCPRRAARRLRAAACWRRRSTRRRSGC